MIRGLFGKLPAKRDFVAARVPPGVLHPFETWLQTSLAVSRQKMGPGWTEAYLRAPIWRFWIGGKVLGQPIVGAMMPSLDGVGRYFPLVAMFIPPEGRAFATPSRKPQDAWFLSVEDMLLRALEEDAPYERLAAEIDAIEPPEHEPVSSVGGVIRIDGNAASAAAPDPDNLAPALAYAQAEELDDALQHLVFWWTMGGEGFVPQAMSTRQLPPHDTFRHFLVSDYPVPAPPPAAAAPAPAAEAPAADPAPAEPAMPQAEAGAT
jgi:type VI secretion system protein ImpM